jgi:short subunit dehydrogenase-like uncharacterized protein
MIYGAYGYTGRLIVEAALARGLKPVLAGRDAQRTADLGVTAGLPVRIFGLEDQEAARRGVHGMKAVLHCAGPFSSTAAPMLEACLAEGASYLDITGEIDVFEMVHAPSMRERLATRGIAAIPGVGFDVVPTDALAALLKEQLPDATTLKLAFKMRGGGVSPGTAKTMVEGAGAGKVRRDGRIVDVPTLYGTRRIPFPGGPSDAVTIPWGDVSTAFHSTGIPNIEVYLGVTPKQLSGMRATAPFQWLMKPKVVQRFLKGRITKTVPGPDAEQRKKAFTELWGEVTNAAGGVRTLTMRTPEGYTLTAETAIRAVERVLEGQPGPGAWTPSAAFGAHFALEVPGVELFAPQV